MFQLERNRYNSARSFLMLFLSVLIEGDIIALGKLLAQEKTETQKCQKKRVATGTDKSGESTTIPRSSVHTSEQYYKKQSKGDVPKSYACSWAHFGNCCFQ